MSEPCKTNERGIWRYAPADHPCSQSITQKRGLQSSLDFKEPLAIAHCRRGRLGEPLQYSFERGSVQVVDKGCFFEAVED